MSHRATAVAHPNIALAKYWGKQPFGHNLPAVPSLSVTLAGMTTTTSVELVAGLGDDELVLGGHRADEPATARVRGLLDRVRARTSSAARARVVSSNDFPTAAGLASSASAFAALAVAAAAAFDLTADAADLSDLARRTSVSAARSIFGGFVALRAGEPDDETLAAEPLAPPDHWALSVIVAVVREGPKDTSSTAGMLHTVRTSPYFAAWVHDAPHTFERVHRALLGRDLGALGDAIEASALRMHASAFAAEPGLCYWTGATVEVMSKLRALRAAGTPAWFTIDAGPHVKVVTATEHEAAVTAALAATPGVLRTIATRPGAGARLVEPP